jgi:purine-cytosine permease-like protein
MNLPFRDLSLVPTWSLRSQHTFKLYPLISRCIKKHEPRFTKSPSLFSISWCSSSVVGLLTPRRRPISVFGGVVIVFILAACFRTKKFVNHLTYSRVLSFQRIWVHCNLLPNTHWLLLVQAVLLCCFYSVQTMFSNVASRLLDDRDNNKGRREKCIWRHWPCSPIG